MSSFIQKCLTGEALFDDIDDYIDIWHDSQGDEPIYEFLGMTQEEYARWVKNPDCLSQIIIAHFNDTGVEEQGHEEHLAVTARSHNPTLGKNVVAWLKDNGL